MADSPVRFEDLIDRHHDELLRYLWRLMDDSGRSHSAEDVLQDVFVRAYRAFPRLRPSSNYRAWLYRIATNCAYSALKRRMDKAPLDDEGSVHDPSPPLDDQLGWQETLSLTKEALYQLPPTQQAALVMRYLQEMDYGEIAEALACSQESARANVSHALRQLRRILVEPLT